MSATRLNTTVTEMIPNEIKKAAKEAFEIRGLWRDVRNYSEAAAVALDKEAVKRETQIGEWAHGKLVCPECGDDISRPCGCCSKLGWESGTVIEAVVTGAVVETISA